MPKWNWQFRSEAQCLITPKLTGSSSHYKLECFIIFFINPSAQDDIKAFVQLTANKQKPSLTGQNVQQFTSKAQCLDCPLLLQNHQLQWQRIEHYKLRKATGYDIGELRNQCILFLFTWTVSSDVYIRDECRAHTEN